MRYSRLASVEEKRNIRRAFVFGTLTIASLILLFIWGIPALGNFAGFLTELKKTEKPIDKNDKIPPPPPRINDLPDFTNQTSIDLSGTAEPGATVKIFFNSKEEDVLVDKDGKFSKTFGLNKGSNTFFAIAVDTAGNESQKSTAQTITFDNDPPDITIDSPSDGASFFGSSQRQLTIKGKTEAGINLFINDRVVAVDDSGNFVFATTLSEGENNFDVKATDKAGNTTEKSLKVTFTP